MKPLQRQQVEFQIGGLDEETAPLLRGPGLLDKALNVVFDKTGRLRKRRGYRYSEIASSEGVVSAPTFRCVKVTTFRHELVVFCSDKIVALASPEGSMNQESTGIVRGSPIHPISLSVEHLTTGPISDRGGVG